jgi:hypothetical protein
LRNKGRAIRNIVRAGCNLAANYRSSFGPSLADQVFLTIGFKDGCYRISGAARPIEDL